MKITRSRLQRIIREEVSRIFEIQQGGRSSNGSSGSEIAYPGGEGLPADVSATDVATGQSSEMMNIKSQIDVIDAKDPKTPADQEAIAALQRQLDVITRAHNP